MARPCRHFLAFSDSQCVPLPSPKACAPGEKFPGDDSPVVWGTCGHAFHLQCITKWLGTQGAEPKCPICRGNWEFKAASHES